MTDSILIVGGGVAGLHAALECADAGARAIVVERGPVVGGRLAAPMTAAQAIGNRAEGMKIPLFDALGDNDLIEILTLSTLETIEGRPGNFTASVRERARFVTDACTRCKLCRAVCPVVLGNEFDAGLTYRKAIYTPLSETLPEAYVIDIDVCLNTPPNYLPCNRCVEVCDDDAIHFDLPLDTLHERQVGAIVLAPGFQVEDGSGFADLGYGASPDVVTSAELQRLLEAPGPTGGFASRPSDEEYPDSVLIVLDDPSNFSLYVVASQANQLIEQDIATVAALVLSPPPDDGDYAEALQLAEKTGINVRWGATFRIDTTPANALQVSYEDLAVKRYTEETYDMVVLCTDVEPPDGIAGLAEVCGTDLSDDGYIAVTGTDRAGVCTSRAGVFVAGCASGPKNIRDSIAAAKAAAAAALEQLDPRLLAGTMDAAREQPPPGPASQVSPEDMRAQIERLLYALIDRPG